MTEPRDANRLAASNGKPHWDGPKPRLAFFRPVRMDLPSFVTGHLNDHVRCLGQFFDVTVITDDADYDKVCDRLQPDLALFESGAYVRSTRRIRNTATHPEVLKLGLLDADAYCVTRSVFLADMDEWGVGDFVTHSVAMSGHTPDIADSLISWPNFAESAIYHSYAGGKSERILLSGSRASNYPWRVAVDRAIEESYPVRTMPHGGWFDRAVAAGMPVGADYARRLSAALIVPTCGTIAHELVRKHLEIPASGALLLTERTPAVEAAGFIDGENCVFSDEVDAVARLEYLFANPDELSMIAAAGQRLAHAQHDIDNRDQVRQWYELTRAAVQRGRGERVVQRDPFTPLELVPAGIVLHRDAPSGRDLDLIAEGTRAAAAGELPMALRSFNAALALHFIPEAALGLARSQIAGGQPGAALETISFTIAQSMSVHGATRPDPVEWAMLIRALLCARRRRAAIRRARQYRDLRHPELDRVRAYLGIPTDFSVASRRSVHIVSAQTEKDWRASFAAELESCANQPVKTRIPHSFHRSTARRWVAAGCRRAVRYASPLLRR
ncbi:glycosyltransferase family protein [Specibacter sp. RAF43]|uniref:glycosyltransferase family protein n=1 Tax=Specibacter sp. RAF43 TaxID=3233057 RepID=UPI003F986737